MACFAFCVCFVFVCMLGNTFEGAQLHVQGRILFLRARLPGTYTQKRCVSIPKLQVYFCDRSARSTATAVSTLGVCYADRGLFDPVRHSETL